MNLYYHTRRKVLAVSGTDRLTWLQGLITADVVGLANGGVAYGALLNPQGRFLHDFFVFKTEQALYLTPEAARMDDFLARLRRYKLRAAVEFSPAEKLTVLSESIFPTGTEADLIPLVQDSGRLRRALTLELMKDTPVNARIDPRHPALGSISLTDSQHLSGEATTWHDYEQLRIRCGVPDGSRDLIIEQSLLMDYGFDALNGVAWTKGCYVGQEITARMKYKATPKKTFTPIFLSAGTFPSVGSSMDDIGVMGSHEGSWGAALLKIEHSTPGTLHTLMDGLSFQVHTPL